MKRAQRTDLLREMKKSFNRYISILSIIMLGVAFYAGVRSAEPDMQLSTKKYLDETNYMDIRIMGTLGVTEEDVREIGKIDGVAQTEGGYKTELFLEADQRDYQMSVFSLGDVINKVYVTDGRLPENAKECFVDRDFLESHGYKVGDVITLKPDKETDISDVLTEDTFTIAGAGIYPEYLSWQRGAVSIGTGVEDGFLFLPKSAFSMEVYTVIYATVEGAKEINPFTDEYEEYVEEVTERIEAIADVRCEARYAEVTEPYWEDISEAEADIADGEKELADGEKELADGEKELADAEKQISDAEKELAEGKEELLAAERELEEGEQALRAAETELGSGRQEIAQGEAQLQEIMQQFQGMPLPPEIIAAEAELKAKREQLESAEREMSLANGELEKGRREYEDGLAEWEAGVAELEQAKLDLEEGRKEYEDGLAELEQAKLDLEEGKQKLADARKELEEVELPEWYVLDRGTVQQIVEYGSNAERVGNLGDVFPAVFYLVAALVSLTTMTRMIEEERTQIGTMKALGYGKGAIVSKYIWYSMSATLIGGLVGVLIGGLLFPWVIINAYGILYTNIPYLVTPIQPGVSFVSVLIAVGCNLIATLSSCYGEMMAAPAILMRPVAPPAGRRVFLEYITPLWNALNFSWKATCRNLFRYKKRFFMTIFGIGGCMALLLVGFGLRDSIMDIVEKQYEEIWTYDAYLSIEEKEISLRDKEHAEVIEKEMFIQTKTMDMESENATVSATLFVPESLDGLSEFVVLRDRVSGTASPLTEDNLIITEKLAKLLEVSVGDTIELQFDEVTGYPVTIDAIAENYMFHYVYISADYYRALFGEEPEFNQLYLQTKEMTEEEREAFSEEMLSDDGIISVTYVEELQDSVAIMMKAMELVIVVLIVAAGLLAFIVLYNLNNINIIERRRELATLKVLGFYDIEVGNYVYRENVLLTVLGIIAGVIMGFFLHRFVILTVEVDMMMFGREIEGMSYLYSVLLTCLFAVLINVGMFYKLRKIDMVESLKSAE